MIYLITYELKGELSYLPFYDAIKSYGTWAHYIDKMWLIKTGDKPEDIFKKLRPYMDSSDYIFITEINSQDGNYYGFLNKKAWEWIKKNR